MNWDEWFQRVWKHLERSLAEQGKVLLHMECDLGKAPHVISWLNKEKEDGISPES